jgi:RNA polymerase sigma-70 factor (ECF subfamily)
MTTDPSLLRLLAGCRKGDLNAQKALFDAYYGRLLGVCQRYARDRPEAEDMLQETFLAVFRDVHQYDGRGAFEGWLHRVAVRCALQHLRRRNLLRFAETIDALPAAAVAQPHESEGSADSVLALVQALPPGYRAVFNLHCVEGYGYDEIAGQLGIAASSVRSQYARACRMLRQKLEHHFTLHR